MQRRFHKLGMANVSTNDAIPYDVPAPKEVHSDQSSWKDDDCHSIEVDVIVPVHNSSSTIRETIASAMQQVWLFHENGNVKGDEATASNVIPSIVIYVCCYNDSSSDDSWSVLQELQTLYSFPDGDCLAQISGLRNPQHHPIPTTLCIASSAPGSLPRGPAWARNQAVRMRGDDPSGAATSHFLCWLDSDDIMQPTRIYHQVHAMMQLEPSVRLKTLLGTGFDRFTEDADVVSSSSKELITPHYTRWANQLSQDRLDLERFREVTIIQPTWMMCRYWFVHMLHGYLEPPLDVEGDTGLLDRIHNPTFLTFASMDSACDDAPSSSKPKLWRLIHPEVETLTTICVAEDMRLFHEHLCLGGRLQRLPMPLVLYRHRPGVSQSAKTPRKLLLALRVAAFEHAVISSNDPENAWFDRFIVWGAGRDGKDFIKALTPQTRQRVYCILDVDDAKIAQGFYSSGRCKGGMKSKWHIPIVHFCLAVQNEQLRTRMYDTWKHGSNGDEVEGHGCPESPAVPFYGHIEKQSDPNRSSEVLLLQPPNKRPRMTPTNRSDPGIQVVDLRLLPTLPVVVCVAMYRTNGALESNVQLIGRTEGKDLWHIC